jgi:drug/metabolite transporter (DMT)-like permease
MKERWQALTKRGEFWAMVSVLDYTIINLLVRRATGSGDSAIAVTLRALPALIVTATVTLVTPRRRDQLAPGSAGFLGWRPILAILAQALLIFTLGNSLNFLSLKYGGIAITSPVSSLSAIFGGILAYLVLGEVFNLPMFVGMVISTVGVLVLAIGRSQGAAASPYWMRAVLISLLGATGSALGGIFLTYALRRGADVFVAMLLSTATAVVTMFVALVLRGRVDLYWTSPSAVVRDLFVAGLFNAMSLLAITQSLALTSWAVTTTIGRLGVVLAPLSAMIFLGESIYPLMWLGIATVTIGVFVVQWGQMKGKRQAKGQALDTTHKGASAT